MATTSISSLQKRIQGVMIPDLPPFDPTWTLKEYNEQIVIWQRKLHEWMRRQFAQLTGPNIYNELIEQVVEFLTVINESGTAVQGFGPLVLDLFTDATYVNAASAFSGTKYGTLKVPWTALEGLQRALAIGENVGGSGAIKAVRLTGKFTPSFTEDYNFQLIHDDGGRLYINNVLVIDNWGSPGTDTTGSPIAMTAGAPVSFKAEVINNAGTDFNLKFYWNSASETGGNNYDIPYAKLSAP